MPNVKYARHRDKTLILLINYPFDPVIEGLKMVQVNRKQFGAESFWMLGSRKWEVVSGELEDEEIMRNEE
jgi:hypothetical protein